VPYVILGLAAAQAYDDQLFAPTYEEAPIARLPVVSLIAIALLPRALLAESRPPRRGSATSSPAPRASSPPPSRITARLIPFRDVRQSLRRADGQ
jgi:hypothetical protein